MFFDVTAVSNDEVSSLVVYDTVFIGIHHRFGKKFPASLFRWLPVQSATCQ